MGKFYFDDEEEGLAPETSHPNFNKISKEAFYFDCVDEFSPFGNDDGADALYNLTDWYAETQGKEDIMAWLFEMIDGFGFGHKSEPASIILNMEQLNYLLKEDEFLINCMDRTIIGVAFGQYKITGEIDKRLKDRALITIERQLLVNKQMLDNEEIDYSKLLKVVDTISTRPDEDGSTKQLTRQYIQRLLIMKNDLSQFEIKK